MELNPILQIGFTSIKDDIPDRVVAYFVPSDGIYVGDRYVSVMFGLQAAIKDLVGRFSRAFFGVSFASIESDISRIVKRVYNIPFYVEANIQKLHELGFLPIAVSAIPEGWLVDTGVPMFEVYNTVPGFGWLVKPVMDVLSDAVQSTVVAANQGVEARLAIENALQKTCVTPPITNCFAGHCRVSDTSDNAARTNGAWLLSFMRTDNFSAIQWLETYYKPGMFTGFALGPISEKRENNIDVPFNGVINGERLSNALESAEPHSSISFCIDMSFNDSMQDIETLKKFKDKVISDDIKLVINSDWADQIMPLLWDIFGGDVNSKNFKVLHRNIAVIDDTTGSEVFGYMFDDMVKKGFCATNLTVVPYIYTNFFLSDVKVNYDDDACCYAVRFNGMSFQSSDPMSFKEAHEDLTNLLIPVFKDGRMLKEYSLQDVRRVLWRGKF